MPVRPTVQYMLFWFIAETLSPDDEDKVTTASSHPVTSHSNQVDLSIMLESREATTALYPAPTYTTPPMFPANLTLQKRMELEPEGYEPTRHENTGVDDEEAQYTSKLVSIATAKELLGGSIMADVVKRGWDLIQLRLNMEGLGAEFEA
ncbi:hypothetical protein M501DRAFT_1001083 [Patellaria atrata CBS 101060]|uniref:Uncharacterized protein n=1 Tax=Patellaria atrata CBS 101060 TaxID=1346257 RepID=A0A9P4VMA2_9PEZI|nr:hypothetical protein M501DRAFT_1001083 [Patellaria atrata CBS 101060]